MKRSPLALALVNGALIGLAAISLAPLFWMLAVSFMQPKVLAREISRRKLSGLRSSAKL